MTDNYEMLEAKEMLEMKFLLKEQTARIKALEESLRWIVKSCDVKIHRMSLFDEIQEEARSALED